jgi:Ser/Thr protein kinase RdoA (MazF antagonist)
VADHPAAALARVVSEAFGWSTVSVEAGPRGATARIWLVRVGSLRYALKEGLGTRPTQATIAAELAFVERAGEAGLRVPRLHVDRSGRRLVPGPGGTWLRLYDWIDTRPADLGAPATAVALGELLARLHRAAPATPAEADGSVPDPWYEQPPTVADLEAMLAVDAWWAPRLRDRVGSLPDLLAVTSSSDAARLVLCHRDLHPGNVVVDDAGTLVVLDQDDAGPADPARELARALFDWWSDPAPDLDRMRAMYRAYLAAGGPARVREPSDLTMLVSTRLNFLLRQLRIATDDTSGAAEQAWADQEIDEALRIMPTAAQLHEVLATLRADGDGAPAG